MVRHMYPPPHIPHTLMIIKTKTILLPCTRYYIVCVCGVENVCMWCTYGEYMCVANVMLM
jgi:hypothetical protein